MVKHFSFLVFFFILWTLFHSHRYLFLHTKLCIILFHIFIVSEIGNFFPSSSSSSLSAAVAVVATELSQYWEWVRQNWVLYFLCALHIEIYAPIQLLFGLAVNHHNGRNARKTEEIPMNPAAVVALVRVKAKKERNPFEVWKLGCAKLKEIMCGKI